MKYNNFVIIGSGNIAHWLAFKINKSGGKILQIYSKTISHATILAEEFDCEPIDNINLLVQTADIYLFAVTDNAYTCLLSQISFKLNFAVHVSGTLNIDIFDGFAKSYGAFYPFQTLSINDNFSTATVPLLIEGSDKKTEKYLCELGKQFNCEVFLYNGYQRAIIHLSGVFASNFTNHLYKIAFEILQKNDIMADIIIPLIQQTANRIAILHPEEAQTGPAVRRDLFVIEKHLSMLSNDEYKQIYKLLTKGITNFKK